MKYEVVVLIDCHPICVCKFKSITSLARWLEDVDFDRCDLDAYRIADNYVIDCLSIKELWNAKIFD